MSQQTPQPENPPPPPPAAQRPAGQNQQLPPWKEGWVGALVVVLVVGLLLWVFDEYLLRPHFTEIHGDRTTTANYLYMLSAVVAAAGALLQAGVIALAPILSLSLHQSYDALFSFIRTVRSDTVRSDVEQRGDKNVDDKNALVDRCINTLRGYRKAYRWLNPVYYGIWILTCVHLFIFTSRMVRRPWLGEGVMHEAMAFFVTSCVLCLLFAGVSVAFFFLIKPGTTKLDYYTRYFIMEENLSPLPHESKRAKQVLIGLLLFLPIAALVTIAIIREPKPKKLSVAINSLAVATAPVFVAADPAIGVLRRNGLDYSEIPFAAGRLALDALTGGNVDLATVAETPLVLASVNRPDLRVVATIAKSQFRVVALRSAGISAVSDLKGKRVACLVGSSSEYFLWRLLASGELAMADVTLTNLQPPDMVNALRRRDVDAISIWEPHAQRAIDGVGADSNVFDSRGLYTEYFNVVSTVAVLKDEAKRRAISEFLSALTDAARKMRGDAPQAWRVIGARLSMDPRELEGIWSRFSFEIGLPTEALVEAMQGVEGWDAAARRRQKRSPGDLRRLLDDSFVAGRQ